MLDRIKIKQLRIDLNTALEQIGKKYDLIINTGTIRFNETSFRVKIEGESSEAPVEITFDGDTIPQDAEDQKIPQDTEDQKIRKDFQTYAKIFGLDPSDLDKTVIVYGLHHTIVGLKPNNRKYPVIIEDPCGDRQKIEVFKIKNALGRYS